MDGLIPHKLFSLYDKINWSLESVSRDINQFINDIRNLPYNVGFNVSLIIVIDILFLLIILHLYNKRNRGGINLLLLLIPFILSIPFYFYGHNYFEHQRVEIYDLRVISAHQMKPEYKIENRVFELQDKGYKIYRHDIKKEHKAVLTIDPPITNFTIIGFCFALEAFILFLAMFEFIIYLIAYFRYRPSPSQIR
jgi:hypothetical protein